MNPYHTDKIERTRHYYRRIHGWQIKQQNCTACNGSGYYDDDGSPPCGGCDGTGKEETRTKGPKVLTEEQLNALITRMTHAFERIEGKRLPTPSL